MLLHDCLKGDVLAFGFILCTVVIDVEAYGGAGFISHAEPLEFDTKTQIRHRGRLRLELVVLESEDLGSVDELQFAQLDPLFDETALAEVFDESLWTLLGVVVIYSRLNMSQR